MNLTPTRNRLVDSAIILIFLVALSAPLLTWLAGKDIFYSEVEKRELQPFPSITRQDSITGFSRAFDDYFQDHFGLREWLIHRYQREVRKRFGISGVPVVVEGRDGWYYFSGERSIDDLKGDVRFSKEDEQLFWRKLSQKEEWFKKRGAAYIFLVAPNKQSIYPEYLPLHYLQGKKASRLDQLLAARPQKAGQTFLDIRSRLSQGKSMMRLYDKSDTHWNYQGAYLAYQAIMERTQSLFPDFQVPDSFQFAPMWGEYIGGDLALMMGRRKSIVEKRPILERRDFISVRKELGPQLTNLLTLRQLKPFYSEKQSGKLRVLVLHDSFFNHLKPFMGESFGEVLYIWQYYDKATLEFFSSNNLAALMEIYQPDLVIEETLERYLPRFLSISVQD